MKKDRIFINISTVNSFLNGRILNVYIYLGIRIEKKPVIFIAQ
jgi:hypothetical protein